MFNFFCSLVSSDNCKFSPIKPQIYLIETPKHLWGGRMEFLACLSHSGAHSEEPTTRPETETHSP